MIIRSLWLFVLLAVAAGGCWWLTLRLGPLLAGAVWAAGALVACVVGFVLLLTSEVGRATWKNRVAAYLLPCGGRISSGELWPIVVVSWVVWMLVWAAVAVLTPPATELLTAWDVAARVLLGVAWVVDGLAIGYVIGTLRQNFTPGARGGKSLRVIAVIITGLITVSVALHLFGWTTAALIVAGGPLLLVGGGYGLFLVVLLVSGRNSRWN